MARREPLKPVSACPPWAKAAAPNSSKLLMKAGPKIGPARVNPTIKFAGEVKKGQVFFTFPLNAHTVVSAKRVATVLIEPFSSGVAISPTEILTWVASPAMVASSSVDKKYALVRTHIDAADSARADTTSWATRRRYSLIMARQSRTASKSSLNSWQLRTLLTKFNTRHGNARAVPNHEPNKHENATSSTQGKGSNGAKEAVTIPMKRQDGMSSDEDLPSLDETSKGTGKAVAGTSSSATPLPFEERPITIEDETATMGADVEADEKELNAAFVYQSEVRNAQSMDGKDAAASFEAALLTQGLDQATVDNWILSLAPKKAENAAVKRARQAEKAELREVHELCRKKGVTSIDSEYTLSSGDPDSNFQFTGFYPSDNDQIEMFDRIATTKVYTTCLMHKKGLDARFWHLSNLHPRKGSADPKFTPKIKSRNWTFPSDPPAVANDLKCFFEAKKRKLVKQTTLKSSVRVVMGAAPEMFVSDEVEQIVKEAKASGEDVELLPVVWTIRVPGLGRVGIKEHDTEVFSLVVVRDLGGQDAKILGVVHFCCHLSYPSYTRGAQRTEFVWEEAAVADGIINACLHWQGYRQQSSQLWRDSFAHSRRNDLRSILADADRSAVLHTAAPALSGERPASMDRLLCLYRGRELRKSLIPVHRLPLFLIEWILLQGHLGSMPGPDEFILAKVASLDAQARAKRRSPESWVESTRKFRETMATKTAGELAEIRRKQQANRQPPTHEQKVAAIERTKATWADKAEHQFFLARIERGRGGKPKFVDLEEKRIGGDFNPTQKAGFDLIARKLYFASDLWLATEKSLTAKGRAVTPDEHLYFCGTYNVPYPRGARGSSPALTKIKVATSFSCLLCKSEIGPGLGSAVQAHKAAGDCGVATCDINIMQYKTHLPPKYTQKTLEQTTSSMQALATLLGRHATCGPVGTFRVEREVQSRRGEYTPTIIDGHLSVAEQLGMFV
ncbi:hypothetical protein ACM66B_001579 [Microbotryomycetes sp. NB124-2]